MPKFTVDTSLCKGCELCTAVCPKKIVALSKDNINAKGYYCVICTDDGQCSGCAACAIATTSGTSRGAWPTGVIGI